jgi:TetR/AcrR family transcriptional regulator
MATRAPRRSAQQRRRLILQSAQAVFAANNYAKVGTADLAKAAGISEPALYRYFPSKKDLFISTIKDSGARLLEIWERLAMEVVNPLDIIWAIGLGYYDHLRSRSPVIKVLFQAISEADDPDIRRALHENFAAFIRFLKEHFEEAKRRGLIRREVDTNVAAWQFIAMGLGLDLIHLLSFTQDIDRSAVEEWQRLYLSSILERPGGTEPEGRFAAVAFGRSMVDDWRELHLD